MEALQLVLTDAGAREDLRAPARLMGATFDWNTVAEQTVDVYRAALGLSAP